MLAYNTACQASAECASSLQFGSVVLAANTVLAPHMEEHGVQLTIDHCFIAYCLMDSYWQKLHSQVTATCCLYMYWHLWWTILVSTHFSQWTDSQTRASFAARASKVKWSSPFLIPPCRHPFCDKLGDAPVWWKYFSNIVPMLVLYKQ